MEDLTEKGHSLGNYDMWFAEDAETCESAKGVCSVSFYIWSVGNSTFKGLTYIISDDLDLNVTDLHLPIHSGSPARRLRPSCDRVEESGCSQGKSKRVIMTAAMYAPLP